MTKEPRKIARVRVLEPEDVEGLYLVRQALEMVAARLCAKRIKDEEIEPLKQLIEPLKQLIERLEVEAGKRDLAACDQLDIEIHRHIVHWRIVNLSSKRSAA